MSISAGRSQIRYYDSDGPDQVVGRHGYCSVRYVRGREASEDGDLSFSLYCKLQSIVHFARGVRYGS